MDQIFSVVQVRSAQVGEGLAEKNRLINDGRLPARTVQPSHPLASHGGTTCKRDESPLRASAPLCRGLHGLAIGRR